MSKFITRLDVEMVGESTWRLQKPLSYHSDTTDSTITVPIGFETDFASVPRLPLVYEVMGNRCHEAATLHDWLYASMQFDRLTSDKILFEAVVATTCQKWRAYLMYLGVRIFGRSRYGT
jgi:hypothetical protein